VSYFGGDRGGKDQRRPTHANGLSEKEQEREYMAFIANQRPILPALKDAIKSHFDKSLNAATKSNVKSETKDQEN